MQKSSGTILIIDDNPEVLIAMDMYLSKYFTKIITEKNPNLIPHLMQQHRLDVIVLDMNFSAGINSGNEGFYWLREILRIDPAAMVIFITAYGDIELAVKGIKEGAVDFIAKPWENEKLLATVKSAFMLRRSKMEIRMLKNKQHHLSESLDRFYRMNRGTSATMQKIFKTIEKVAPTDASILITGENGTGKELLAREIHKLSNQDVFISVDIASLPESLLESELFGHKAGSFTDAKHDKPGRFQLADGGTLFLDEIGNIPLNIQSKILTVLQNREIVSIGETLPVPVNFRLIAATNQSLDEMVEKQLFRKDLLYRINTIRINLPPLRDRKEDIPILATHFIKIIGRKYRKPNLMLHATALDVLLGYDWPGNIRELEHSIEKAVIMTESRVIGKSAFHFSRHDPLKLKSRMAMSLEEHEKIIIAEMLLACNGNISEAADRLGITRATLYRKLNKYEL